MFGFVHFVNGIYIIHGVLCLPSLNRILLMLVNLLLSCENKVVTVRKIYTPQWISFFFKRIQWDMECKGRWLVPRILQIINNKVEKLVDVAHKKHNRYVVFWTPFNSTQNRTVFFFFLFCAVDGWHTCCQKIYSWGIQCTVKCYW